MIADDVRNPAFACKFVIDFFKSPRRLEAENLFLRHQLSIALRRARPRLRLRGSDRCPYRKLKTMTVTANRLIVAPNERSFQVDLVRLDRNIPTAGCVASRDPCPSTSTHRAAAQIPEAIGVR
jgi:hypothetical protein